LCLNSSVFLLQLVLEIKEIGQTLICSTIIPFHKMALKKEKEAKLNEILTAEQQQSTKR